MWFSRKKTKMCGNWFDDHAKCTIQDRSQIYNTLLQGYYIILERIKKMRHRNIFIHFSFIMKNWTISPKFPRIWPKDIWWKVIGLQRPHSCITALHDSFTFIYSCVSFRRTSLPRSWYISLKINYFKLCAINSFFHEDQNIF